MENQPITVKAIVNAPIQQVWQAWTDPKAIMQWNFASTDWHCPKASNDLRVSGTFVYRMAAKDGSVGFDFTGTYTQIVLEKKIAYTMPDQRNVVVVFEAMENQTIVTETFDPETTNSRELQENGWQAILNQFKQYVENH